MKVRLFLCLVLFVFAFAPSSLFSQAPAQAPCNPMPCPTPNPPPNPLGSTLWEINPYAGWYWSGTNGSGPGRFFNTQYLGVRGGGYITPSFQLGGNWNWTNHFQPNQSNTGAALAGALGFPQGAVRAHLWEVEYTYNFAKRNLFGSPTVRPYIVGGTGGITTSIKNENSFVLNVRAVNPQRTRFVANDVLDSGDTFFTFSYGG